MDKIFEKKHKENLRKLHDTVKDHPFWKTLSNDFHVDCMEKMREMFDYFIAYFTKENIKYSPQAIILFECLHDIYDCMLKAKIMPKYNHMTVMEINGFGNYILALQTALQLVHYYLDGIFDEGMVVGYEPRFAFDKEKEKYTDCIIHSKYGARGNDDGTYRLVQIINKKEINEIIEIEKNHIKTYADIAKYFDEHNQKEYAEQNFKISKYHEEKYNDLINNKEKYYIIK